MNLSSYRPKNLTEFSLLLSTKKTGLLDQQTQTEKQETFELVRTPGRHIDIEK